MISIPLRIAAARRRLRAGAIGLATLLAVALMGMTAPSACAATYVVDNQHPNSSPAGPGTEAEPYSSISAAVAARKGPGITILVRPGVYREQVTVPASGAPDAPFVILAEGPGVVVDGADDFSSEGQWVRPAATVAGPHDLQVSDHAWLAPAVTWAAEQVFVDGRRLTLSTAPPTELPVGGFTWIEGEGLYVNLGVESPAHHEVLVGRRASGFRLGGKSWVTIEGFEILRTEDSSINLFFGCTDVAVVRNRVAFSNSYGIKVSGSTRVLIEGNSVSENNYHGIGLTAGAFACTVRGNESFRNAQPGVRAAKGIYLGAAPNNLVVGNRTYENQDTGVQVNAGSHACVLINNRSWSNGDHGYDHLDAIGTTHLHNVAHGNYKDGFSVEGDSPNTRIYNCIATDNGLTTGRFDLWVNAASAVGFSSGYNIIWNSTSQEPIKFMTTKYSLVTDFNTASGRDENSMQVNPMFADAAGGDFRPLPGSPAIDAGDSGMDYWPTCDINGSPRYDDPSIPNTGSGPVSFADIGPIEYGASPADGAIELPTPPPAITDRYAIPYGATASRGSIALSTGYPNPSRGPIEFALDLPHDSRVEWAVYDLQGRTVWSEGRMLAAGRTQLRWDGTGAAGAPAATGVYLVRARVDGAELTRRIIRF